MSHGKLSPRQKMINMMYLILTALLAMNVSAEVLNAFVLVNDSLKKTERNVKAKNESIYAEFDNKYKTDPGKVGPWKDKATKVSDASKVVIDYINKLESDLLKAAGDDVAAFEKEGSGAIENKKDKETPTRILVDEGHGNDIKLKIEDFRKKIIEILGNDSSAITLKSSILKMLNTDKIKSQEGDEVDWAIGNFEQLPLVAAMTMLSKMRTDVLNAESDVSTFLMTKIDAGSYKFNKLEAIVVAEKDFVLVGEPYKAEIFIVASDTTRDPKIFVGEQPIRIDSITKKGIYTGGTGSPGVKSFSGSIKVNKPGTTIEEEFKFSKEYQVAAPSVSVSPTRMNVFYVGVENPVDITAAGIPGDQLNVSMSGSGGKIRRKGSGYVVNVRSVGNTTISVTANGKSLGRRQFRCKRVPDPMATVGSNKQNWKGGAMAQTTLAAMSGVSATLEDFVFDLRFVVTSFTVNASIGGFDESSKSNSYRFTPKQKQIIRKAKRRQRVTIEDIRARAPDGTIRRLPSIVFKLL